MSKDVLVKKGTRVRVHRELVSTPALAGAQMKVQLTVEDFWGEVTHVYGDHPQRPTRIWFTIKRDEDGLEVEGIQKKEIVDAVSGVEA